MSLEYILDHIWAPLTGAIAWLLGKIFSLESQLSQRPTMKQVTELIDLKQAEMIADAKNLTDDVKELKIKLEKSQDTSAEIVSLLHQVLLKMKQ